MPMLEVKNLGISFGGLRAVNEFSLKIEKGQLYGLIGPNGAGKTTVFNLLTGVYRPDTGRILHGKTHHGDQQSRHRPYVSEYPPVRQAECTGQCQGRHA